MQRRRATGAGAGVRGCGPYHLGAHLPPPGLCCADQAIFVRLMARAWPGNSYYFLNVTKGGGVGTYPSLGAPATEHMGVRER